MEDALEERQLFRPLGDGPFGDVGFLIPAQYCGGMGQEIDFPAPFFKFIKVFLAHLGSSFSEAPS